MTKNALSAEDEINLAIAFFNKKKVTQPNTDLGPRFKFIAAWKMLRDFTKFNAAVQAVSGVPKTNAMDGVGIEWSEEMVNIKGVTRNTGGRKTEVLKVERPLGRQRSKKLGAFKENRSKKVKMEKELRKL